MSEARELARAQYAGLLGDNPTRDYSHKLSQFNAFAEPELHAAIRSLNLEPGMHVLDVGCGTGEALGWLREQVAPAGKVTGVDLAAAHIAVARRRATPGIKLYQANLFEPLFDPSSFDLVWCVNTINHLSDPVAGAIHLATLLRDGGRLALGQSCLLPDMFFAWDAPLERAVNDAVRRYYQERYDLDDGDLQSVRALVGILRQGSLRNVIAHTIMIERVSPLDPATESYLRDTIFLGTWSEKLRRYMRDADFEKLTELCDPGAAGYALRRPDFHFLQTFTLVIGEV
jgi:ubiquinone/menaquinone biosynthesis C-methylase UbiE